jgi:hypothetical protein
MSSISDVRRVWSGALMASRRPEGVPADESSPRDAVRDAKIASTGGDPGDRWGHPRGWWSLVVAYAIGSLHALAPVGYALLVEAVAALSGAVPGTICSMMPSPLDE